VNDLLKKAHGTAARANLVLALGVCTAALAAPGFALSTASAPAQEQFVCRLAGFSDRLIGVYRAPQGTPRCRVDYTRDGKTRSLWKAGHQYAYCVRKAVEIVDLLEKVHFKCTPQTQEPPASAPAG
jgi:hypothetical protein